MDKCERNLYMSMMIIFLNGDRTLRHGAVSNVTVGPKEETHCSAVHLPLVITGEGETGAQVWER